MSVLWTILMISLFCLGFREITDHRDGGRIGYPLRKLFEEKIPIWIGKPIILCCACMASFWGTVIYWLVLYHFNADSFAETLKEWETYGLWIFCCVSASFINTLLWVIRNRLIGL